MCKPLSRQRQQSQPLRLSRSMLHVVSFNPPAGTMSKAEIEDSYKISRRIEGEERGLDYATMVFTSTQQEVTTLLNVQTQG
jgi:hypothetical protein